MKNKNYQSAKMEGLKQLIEISREYGADSAYVIAGGGNTSYKNPEKIWIKASGIPLAGIDEGGLVCLSREKLGRIEVKVYSQDARLREEEVKADMKLAIIEPQDLRPSVETSLHNLMDYAFVVHTHPTLINGLLCAQDVSKELEVRFGERALYVEYTDPGYILFKKLQEDIGAYTARHQRAPQLIFLQNHGIFVAANSIEEIRELYREVEERISAGVVTSLPDCSLELYDSKAMAVVSEFAREQGLVSTAVSCPLVRYFTQDVDHYLRIDRPFSPDIIVYCKSNYLFLGKDLDANLVLDALAQFQADFGHPPRVVLEEGGGLLTMEDHPGSARTVQQVYLDLMKISYLSEQFGGPHFMSPEQIRFIDHWEVENYRRKVAKSGTG